MKGIVDKDNRWETDWEKIITTNVAEKEFWFTEFININKNIYKSIGKRKTIR